MKPDSRFIARAALFSALAYVFALLSFYIPNVSLIFIVIFASGALLGLSGGLVVGGLGMLLWTVFNPFGMTSLPMTLSQITGAMAVGALGAVLTKSSLLRQTVTRGWSIFALFGFLTAFIYQLFVSLTLAYLYGPFWPALASNLAFAVIMIFSNIIIFIVCYPLVVKLKQRGSVI